MLASEVGALSGRADIDWLTAARKIGNTPRPYLRMGACPTVTSPLTLPRSSVMLATTAKAAVRPSSELTQGAVADGALRSERPQRGLTVVYPCCAPWTASWADYSYAAAPLEASVGTCLL